MPNDLQLGMSCLSLSKVFVMCLLFLVDSLPCLLKKMSSVDAKTHIRLQIILPCVENAINCKCDKIGALMKKGNIITVQCLLQRAGDLLQG